MHPVYGILRGGCFALSWLRESRRVELAARAVWRETEVGRERQWEQTGQLEMAASRVVLQHRVRNAAGVYAL